MITKIITCRDCGTTFEGTFVRGAWPGRCPACADIAQRRPTVIQERVTLYGPVLAVIDSLPGNWEEYTARRGDAPVFKIERSGAEFGASWSGRVVLFAPKPFATGDIVVFEEIEAKHKVLSVRYIKGWVNQYGEACERECVTSVPPAFEGNVEKMTNAVRGMVARDWPDATVSNIEVEGTTIEMRRYVRLDMPTQEAGADDKGLPRLVWRQAHFKTTIKGFGRQYAYDLKGSPLWAIQIRGSVRSGRLGATAALALVDADHPLERVELFNF